MGKREIQHRVKRLINIDEAIRAFIGKQYYHLPTSNARRYQTMRCMKDFKHYSKDVYIFASCASVTPEKSKDVLLLS